MGWDGQGLQMTEIKQLRAGLKKAIRAKDSEAEDVLRSEIARIEADLITEDDNIDPHDIEPPHEVRDEQKKDAIVKSMKINGWQGRPILVQQNYNGNQAITGSHRIAAAQEVGLESIPVVFLGGDELSEDDWDKWYGCSDDYDRLVWIKEHLPEHTDAIQLMEMEIEGNSEVARLNPEYSGMHEAPTKGEGSAPLWDVAGIYPDDIYGPMAVRYYGHYGDYRDAEAIHVIQRMHGHPNRQVRIYRAVPKDVKGSAFNVGDWVTTVRSYAKEHGESALNGEYRVISKVVHPRDLFTDGNSIFEFGYDPQPFTGLEEEKAIKRRLLGAKV